MLLATICEGTVFTVDIFSALLAVGHQVPVSEVVAGRGLVARDPGAIGDREREARQPTHVGLVGS